MPPMDDAINNLSSDELDLLNSDPKLLNDFKTKYSTPPTNTQNVIGAVGDQLKKSLLPDTFTFNQPISGTPTEMMGQMLDPISGLTRAYATEKAGVGNVVDKMANAGDIGDIGKFVLNTAADPATYAGLKGSLLPEDITSQTPKLLERIANLPEKATEFSGASESTPTQEEIQKGIKKVQDMVTSVWKDHGQTLNAAKAEADIPVTEDQVAQSVRRYGNAFNVDMNKPLDLPESMSKPAPAMEQPPITPLKIGDTVTATHPTQPPVTMTYKMPGMMVGTNDPAFDLKTPVPAPGKTWAHPVDSTLSKSTLESYGYKVPEGTTPPELNAPASPTPMPYQIGPHDTPEDLMTEINRFKSNQDFIKPQDKAKVASYLQDQIGQKVDFTKPGNRVEGVLKSQYHDLKDIISNSSPTLQAAKSKMGDLYDTMSSINKKLSGTPAEAEGYLRKLFTSKNPETKDDLEALTKLEHLSGKPVMQELFKKFAGEAYGQVLGENVRSIFHAPYAALTSPKFAMTPLMKYGPAAIKAAKFGGAGALENFSLRQISPESVSQLQSVKDRISNAQ